MLAMAWAPETRALPDLARPSTGAHHAAAARDFDSAGAAEDGDSEALPPRLGGNDKSVLVAQATVSDPGQSSKREHNWAETLSCELTNAWRDIELLHRLEHERDRAESLEQGFAAARRDVKSLAALTAEAVEEAARVKQAAQGDAELLNSLQEARERAERLERDLAVARRDAETQTALATKAGEETSRLKAAGEGGAADLQKERGRSGRLEQDLAAARRDTETQTALAAKASEEASRLKGRGGEADLQKERERFARLEQDLAAARRDAEAQAALAAKVGHEASRLKRMGESGAAELQTSLQKERERSAQLEQDLAAARRDVEAQTALAARASEEGLRNKRAAEAGAAELRKSRERAEVLVQDLSLSRSSIYAYEAQSRKAGDDAAELRQAAANGAASLRKSTPEERERFARLEQDLAAARRGVETQTALAAKAGEEASRLKQERESGAAELQSSLQKERERSARLEQDLAAVRRDVETKTALVTKAGEEASRLIAAGKGGAADLQKERERSARLEQDLAAARRDAETKTALVTRAAEEMARLTAIGKSGAVGLQNERERSARLEQDLAVVRRDVETQTARAAKASGEALLQKQMAEAGAAELKQKRARTDAQAQSLPLSRSAIHAYEAQARKAGNEAAEIGQGTANGAPSLRTAAEAPDRAEPLGPNLAPAQGAASDLGTTGSTARDKSIEVAANPVAGRTPAAPARGAAQPNTEQAAEAAALVARASSLLRQGNIGAARLVLERAVEMASAQASFALAETYDPLVLAKWGTYGTRGDARRAQDLYARADAAGIQGAKSRLDALRR